MAGAKKKEGSKAAPSEEVDVATALGNPWRYRIVYAATLKPLGPSDFVREYGGEISNISRHFRDLRRWGYLKKVKTVTGGTHRGATKSIYRATQRGVHIDVVQSRELPRAARETISNTIIRQFFDQVAAAIDCGTLDSEVERHMAWDLIDLDAQGFQELNSWLDDVLERLPTLRSEARQRLDASGEEPIPATLGMFLFRSPTGVDAIDE